MLLGREVTTQQTTNNNSGLTPPAKTRIDPCICGPCGKSYNTVSVSTNGTKNRRDTGTGDRSLGGTWTDDIENRGNTWTDDIENRGNTWTDDIENRGNTWTDDIENRGNTWTDHRENRQDTK